MALSIRHHTIEELLAIAPHAGVQRLQRLRIAPRALSVPEIERLRDHVRQADRQR